MLQRAASNAYSWWWASHIRTKQSKWLDNHLQGIQHPFPVTQFLYISSNLSFGIFPMMGEAYLQVFYQNVPHFIINMHNILWLINYSHIKINMHIVCLSS
jgi:hypothetical protein